MLLVGPSATSLGPLLNASRFSVASCLNGEEGLTKLAGEGADLLLTDVALTGLSGRELSRIVRGDPAVSGTPVLFVSRAGEPWTVTGLLEAGADGLVLLPTDSAALEVQVESALASESRAGAGATAWLSAAFHEALRSNAALTRRLNEIEVSTRELRRYADRLETEAELGETRNRALARGARDGFLVTDSQGILLEASDRALAMLEQERSAVVGRKLFEAIGLAPAESSSLFLELTTTARTRELGVRSGHPGERWLELSGSDLTDGAHRAVLIVARDITERKRTIDELRATQAALLSAMAERAQMQVELVQAQKLEAVGQLAAGIAHEINTPTQYIGDNVHFMKAALDELLPLLDVYGLVVEQVRRGDAASGLLADLDRAVQEARLPYLRSEIPKAIEQSLEGLERVATIVQAMKEFSHPGGAEKTPIDINRALRLAATVACNEWKYVAELEFDLDENLALVPCLPGELNQTLLNLIVNAAHAIAEKGGTEKGCIMLSTRGAGGSIEIRISDSGTGIPDAIKDKIYNPFFTTKKVGKGTGQGLAIARSVVVDKHGGRLFFESRPGGGTTFVVRLPLTARSKGMAAP